MISRTRIAWPSRSQAISLLTTLTSAIAILSDNLPKAKAVVHVPHAVTVTITLAALLIAPLCRSILQSLSGLAGQQENVPVEDAKPPVGIDPGPPIAVLLLFALLGSALVRAQTPNVYPVLPDHKLTPGAVLPVTVADIAVRGYAHKVRNVPESVKRAVYAEYHIVPDKTHPCEVDHLISLELGGSNDIKNLWPQSYIGTWNAHIKDGLENELHRRVCLPLASSDYVPLTTAQHEISTDWIAAYKKYFHTPVPLLKVTPPTD